jgi:hypothetical protein
MSQKRLEIGLELGNVRTRLFDNDLEAGDRVARCSILKRAFAETAIPTSPVHLSAKIL